MSSTYVYRLLKSSWGIRIKVTGRSEDVRPAPKDVTRRGRVSVRFTDAAASLADELRAEIVTGLSMIEDEIVGARNGADVSVAVEEVKFNDADFQIEGLRVAMIRWAEQHFDLAEHPIEASFDRSLNRYFFGFS